MSRRSNNRGNGNSNSSGSIVIEIVWKRVYSCQSERRLRAKELRSYLYINTIIYLSKFFLSILSIISIISIFVYLSIDLSEDDGGGATGGVSHSNRGLLLRAAKDVVVGAGSDGLDRGGSVGRGRGLVGDVAEGDRSRTGLGLDRLGGIVSAAEADRSLASRGSVEAGGGALNDEVLGGLG